jgi:uncharacterized phage protein gp47/JayE
MPTLTLAQLLSAKTPADFVSALLAEFSARNFPVTSWVEGGAARTLVESFAEVMADFSAAQLAIAKGGLLEEAEGPWLTLLARSNYSTVRKEATFAEWTVTLACSASAGPFTILPGQLWIASPSGLLFNNKNGGTLATNGTLALTFRAEQPGTTYNAGPLAVLKTPLPGVSVLASVLASSAVDEETDDQVSERAALQWALLATGATEETYKKWALDADPDVRRVRVLENLPVPGSVKVFIAREDSSALPADVTTVSDFINARRPLCVQVDVAQAVAVNVSVAATVRIRAADLATAQARIGADLLTLFRGLSIGDGSTTPALFKAELVEVLMALPGARNAVLSAPTDDVVLALGEVAVLSGFDPLTSITWQTF